MGRTVFEFSNQKVLVLYSQKCHLQRLFLRTFFFEVTICPKFLILIEIEGRTVFEISIKMIRFYKLPKHFRRIQILNRGLMALILVISKQSTVSAGIEKENVGLSMT